MNHNSLNINLILTGESCYFLEMMKAQTEMEYSELFSKMIDLYKQVYLNQYELAWVEGDIVISKLSTINLFRSSN